MRDNTADLVDDITASINATISEQEKVAEEALENGSVAQAAREQVRLSAMTKVKMDVINAVIRHCNRNLQELG